MLLIEVKLFGVINNWVDDILLLNVFAFAFNTANDGYP